MPGFSKHARSSSVLAVIFLLTLPFVFANQPKAQPLEGIYSLKHTISYLKSSKGDGEWAKRKVSNCLAIYPTETRNRYSLEIDIEANNGHGCGWGGNAERQGNMLVTDKDENGCSMRIEILPDQFVTRDSDLSCQSYCGMRASLNNNFFPRKSRKPLPKVMPEEGFCR